jgi:hypothetical protein
MTHVNAGIACLWKAIDISVQLSRSIPRQATPASLTKNEDIAITISFAQ